MNRTLDNRVRRIETALGNSIKRMVWIDADTVKERRDRISHLIESGRRRQQTPSFHGWHKMNRALDSRHRKVEEAAGVRNTRLFVVDSDTLQEREAHIAALAASGHARQGDSFVYTGVRRSANVCMAV